MRSLFRHPLGCQGCVRSSRFRSTQARIRGSARWVRAIHANGDSPPRSYDRVRCLQVLVRRRGVQTYVLTGFIIGPCGSRIAHSLAPLGWSYTPDDCLERSCSWLTDFRNKVHRRKGCLGIHRQSSPFVRSSTSMLISGRYYPYVSFESISMLQSLI